MRTNARRSSQHDSELGSPRHSTRDVFRIVLRVHSLRYYFRTQLTALGVNPEYAEFLMGHEGALYNDIKMKGPEFLRNIYRAAGLCIRQKTKASRLDLLKEMVRDSDSTPRRS